MQLSFNPINLQSRIKKSPLSKIHRRIDWEAFRPKLKGLYKREINKGGGQEPFDSLLMFKAILLG